MANLKQKINIPQGWALKRLGDVLDYERPDNYIVKSTSYADNRKTPVLTANKSFVLGYTDENFGIYEKMPCIIFDDFTTDSKFVDFPFKVKSSAIKILKNKNENTDLRFVFERMKLINFPMGNHKRYYISQYQDLEILIPKSIIEQQKIAEVLGVVDEDIAKTQDVIEAAEKLKKGLMQQLFTRGIGHTKFKKTKLGEIPEEWEVVNGGDISELITKGASPRWQGFEYQNDGMIFVTSENVRDGRLDLSVTKFLPMEFYYKLKNSQLKQGDILINIVGASIARSCIYDGNYKYANINQAVCLMRIKNSISRMYVLQYLQSPETISRLLGSQGGSARANLSLADMRNFDFVLPGYEEQQKIAEILSAVDEKISVNKKLKNKLTILKKGLMQDLLSGNKRIV